MFMKRYISVFVVLALAVSLLPHISTYASAVSYSGNCGKDGDNLTWSVDSDRKTLTISGSGEMMDFDSDWRSRPWYQHNSTIQTVILPDGLINIGNYAFSHAHISDVTIPESVSRIGEGAFAASSISYLEIPKNVTEIGSMAFLGDLTNGLSVSSENEAFICDPNGALFTSDYSELLCFPSRYLGTYTVPDSVKRIDAYAFFECFSLTWVTVPDNVEEIGEYAFYGSCLGGITLGNGLSDINDWCFSHCINLSYIEIPEGVTRIGKEAFDECLIGKH